MGLTLPSVPHRQIVPAQGGRFGHARAHVVHDHVTAILPANVGWHDNVIAARVVFPNIAVYYVHVAVIALVVRFPGRTTTTKMAFYGDRPAGGQDGGGTSSFQLIYFEHFSVTLEAARRNSETHQGAFCDCECRLGVLNHQWP